MTTTRQRWTLARDLSEVPDAPAQLASDFPTLPQADDTDPAFIVTAGQAYRAARAAVDQGDHLRAYTGFLIAACLTLTSTDRKRELLRLSREAYARWQLSTLGNVGQASFIDALPDDPTANEDEDHPEQFPR